MYSKVVIINNSYLELTLINLYRVAVLIEETKFLSWEGPTIPLVRYGIAILLVEATILLIDTKLLLAAVTIQLVLATKKIVMLTNKIAVPNLTI